ncbi:MAG TPA: hypothetical protein VM864_02330 [Pyrinomonadaceae bacterium]|jgi:hypothetical protein|nr:hypothetical protein [Pyrinomonadaceae bacterium]
MKKDLTSLLFTALCAVALLPALSRAQNPTAEMHRAEASGPVHFDTTTRPLRDMVETRMQPERPRGGRDFEPGRPQPVGNSNPAGVDPLAMRGVTSSSATASPKAGTIGTPVDPNARVAPPDTTGDLGPNHYVQWVNSRYSVYTLTRDVTNNITGFNPVGGFPKNGNIIWQGFGGQCETANDGDPIVQYDQFADRWVLTQFAVSSTPYLQCVAVSTGPDPTGTYNRYAYSYATDFNDYPKMGVWSDGYYITYNMFRRGRTYGGNQVCAFERDKMLVGAAARQICARTSTSYASLEPADIEGKTLPPAGSPNPLLAISSTSLLSWKFAVNWAAGTGTLTGPTTIAGVAAFSRACGGGVCIPQPGTTQQLDSLGDRLMYRLSYRNFLDHEALLINHSVATGGVTGIRWYELRNAVGSTITGATPVIFQQGTYAPTADYRWMGSAAMDKTGGIAIGYNISNASSIRPSIRYAFRGPLDPAGTLGGETSILAGPGVQTGNQLNRWGDYSTISVDPVDGCTMVFTTEYIPANGSFNWTTFIGSFKLSTCQ